MAKRCANLRELAAACARATEHYKDSGQRRLLRGGRIFRGVAVLTSSRGVVAWPVRSNDRSLYWWSRPSRLVAFVLVPIYLYCGYMDEAFYALYGHQGKYLVGDAFTVGLAALAAFALASATMEGDVGPAPAPAWVNGARARRALLALYVVVLSAYAFFLFPILLRPQLMLEHLRGSVETMAELRNVLNRVPGLTSLVALQSLCVVLTLNYRRLTGEWLPRHYLVLMTMVVVACALRSWLWSERLALVELIVPAAIAKFADLRSPKSGVSGIAGRLLPLAPIAGLGVMFALFSFSEYFRSWQYYKAYLPYTFLEFSWNRFMGYYATALANGALAYSLHQPDFIPAMTAHWLYKLPVWELINQPLEADIDYREFLKAYLNPEFNNMSGVFMPPRDFGAVLGVACWVLLALLSGSMYRSFANGQLFGLILYPAWFVGISEILRVFYWGDQRFFPVLLFGPLLVYYLAASERIYRRRLMHTGLPFALLGGCFMGSIKPAGAAEASDVCAPLDLGAASQIVDVRSFGARGDGKSDDGPAIQAAINSLANPGVVLLPEGTYSHSDVIRVRRDGIVLAGQNATLLASNLDRTAIIMEGKDGVVRDLAINSVPPRRRGDKAEQAGLYLIGQGVAAINNAVEGFIGAGIFVRGAPEFVVACNRVSNTKADGIHITGGATRGKVTRNSIFNSEDDGIGVVAYEIRKQASDILVENNRVRHILWGRGISVVGATKITIRRNEVAGVAAAAGILVAREGFWHTPGASDVLIEDNRVSDIQRNLVPLEDRRRTGHGAIEINSDSSDANLAVRHVRIVGNNIKGAAYYAIRLLGNVCDVSIEGNEIADVSAPGIGVKHGEDKSAGCEGRL
jgi:Pectate lyase superfamily protein